MAFRTLTQIPKVDYQHFRAQVDALGHNQRVQRYVNVFEALGMEYSPQHNQSIRFVGGAQVNIIQFLRVLLFVCTSVVHAQLPPAVVQGLQAISANRCRHFIARSFLCVYANRAMICVDWRLPLLFVFESQMLFFIDYLASPIARSRSAQNIGAQLQALVNAPQQQQQAVPVQQQQ